MQGFSFGKYKVIVVSIALFLVFDLGVLILNFYISSEIAKDATAVNLAGRQRMLSQRMTKSLLDMQNKTLEGIPFNDSLNELQKTYSLFDETIYAFQNGGKATGADGSNVILDKINDLQGRSLLQDSQQVWQPYKSTLSTIVESSSVNNNQLDDAVNYARENNLLLLKLMNDLTNFLEKKATSKANFLRMVQVGGISLATINFIIILFHFIKQLRRNDELLEEAKNENDEILDTVNEGLFLLKKDYTLGSQHSRELGKIFNKDDMSGINFKDFLAKIVPEKTMTVAVDYIDLLFGDRVNEKLVETLNPLDKVEVFFDDDSSNYKAQYLSFTFNRVIKNDSISHLLVTVSDVTNQVLLEEQLVQAEEKSKEQLSLLTEILPINPDSLVGFISKARDTLDQVNNELKKSSRDDYDYLEKVNNIFRLVHRLKGDSAAIGLKYIQSATHDFEKSLVALREKSNLSGNDFLPLTVELEEMYRLIDSIKLLLDKLGNIRGAIEKADNVDNSTYPTTSSQHDWSELQVFTSNLAAKHSKQVNLDLQEINASLPDQYKSHLRELLIQLIRNSIVHGIEEPAVRADLQKHEAGQIRATFTTLHDGSHMFIYQDDGAGFDPIKIKKAAIAKGFFSTEQVSQLSHQDLVKLLFKPGFSTNQNPDEDSGRGVGMDIIRDLISQLGGKLRIGSVPGKYSKFTIQIPALKASKAVA